MLKHKYGKYTLLALWLILAASPLTALAAGSCPKADAAAHVALDAGRRWNNILNARKDASDDSMSAPEREAISSYKQALADVIDARLACSGAKTNPVTLRRTLAAALGAVDRWPAPTGRLSVDVEVQRSVTPRPLILVQAGFEIPCSNDNLLVGYAWDMGGWRRVLHWQSGAYKDISGAYGDGFSFAALPDGQVVVVSGMPWCSSNWSRFRADVIAPADGAAAQCVLFHMEADYYRGRDIGIRLKKLPDGFELRVPVSSRDPVVLIRPGIYRYQVNGETVQRMQPAAVNGRDFVDEWLGVDDTLARAWSGPADAAAALQARQDLQTRIKADDALFSYGPVRACASGTNRYQVEMQVEKIATTGQCVPPQQNWYALIRQEPNGFAMLGLGTTPDSTCDGPDLMIKRGKSYNNRMH